MKSCKNRIYREYKGYIYPNFSKLAKRYRIQFLSKLYGRDVQEVFEKGNDYTIDQLYLKYLNYIKQIVIKIVPHCFWDDYFQETYFIFIKEVPIYNPRKTKFAYWLNRIMSLRIIDLIRSTSLHSRSLKRKANKYIEAKNKIQSAIGRAMNAYELSEMLGEQEPDIIKIYDTYLPDVIHKASKTENKLLAHFISSLLNTVSLEEKTIIYLYYFLDYTQKDISKILHLSESRINQLMRGCLRRLRDAMADG